MTPPEWKQIDEYGFLISPLPGMRGVKVFTKLGKMLAKGAAAADSLKSAKNETEQGMVLLSLLSEVEPEDVEFLCKELLGPAVIRMPNGTQSPLMPVFDTIFQARTDLVFKVLVEAMKLNFGSFFKGLIARLGAQAAGVNASISPSTSPSAGPAGA